MNESSSDGRVAVEHRPDGIAVVRIDRPERNALSTSLLGRLREAAERLAADPPAAVVVWGGPLVFSSGGDAREFDHFDREVGHRVAEAFHGANDALAALPRPTIAAISGVAAGGGLEVALACDLRIAASDARFGQPEITMGLFPGGGATQRLPRLIGPSRAKELIFSGALVDAAEALRIGLVNRVVPADEVFDAALAWAGELANGAGTVRGTAKRLIDEGLELPLTEGLRLEQDRFVRLFDSRGAAQAG